MDTFCALESVQCSATAHAYFVCKFLQRTFVLRVVFHKCRGDVSVMEEGDRI